MPDLEKRIIEWRQQMLAAGIKSPVPLEELESHLREEVAEQIKSGLSEQKAFEVSVRRMGEPKVLKSEFKKVERTAAKKISLFAVLIGTVIILRILTHQHPDAAHYGRNEQVQWLFAGSCILLFGLLNIIFNSNSGEARGVRRWKLVGFAYSMAAVWISLVPIYLLLTVPRYSAAVGMAGRILTFAAVVVSFLSIFGWRMSRGILPVICNHRTRTRIGIASCLFGPLAAALFVWYLVASQSHFSVGIILMTWAWAVMAILGGLGYGLTEAARGQTESARS